MVTGSPPDPHAKNQMAAREVGRPRILLSESEGFSPTVALRLRELGDVRLEDLARVELLTEIAEADVLWIRLRHRIDAEVFAAAPRLRAIVSPTTGVDHIDIDTAEGRSVSVLTLPEHTAALRDVRATAEYTIGLMLSMLRNLPFAVDHVRAGGWNRDLYWGHELYAKTVGIVGYGRLGRQVAHYLRAFDTRVLVSDRPGRSPAQLETGLEFCSIDDLLSRSDIVSLHASLDRSSLGLMGAREFALMRPGSWLVNTARGALVEEPALLAALRDGRLAGAALDVLTDEHGEGSRELINYAREHRNVLVTPHIGGATLESREKTERLMAERLADFLGAENS